MQTASIDLDGAGAPACGGAEARARRGATRQQRNRRDPADRQDRRALPRAWRVACWWTPRKRSGACHVSIADLDATYLVVSSHKIGGPPGAGALVLAPGAPFIDHALRRRPGTRPPARAPRTCAAIVGFGVAAEWAVRDWTPKPRACAACAIASKRDCRASAVVFGADAPRLPNTSNFALPGLAAETAVIAMDLEGVAVSSGAACSSGKVRSSRVLAAMGVAPSSRKVGAAGELRPRVAEKRRRRRARRARQDRAHAARSQERRDGRRSRKPSHAAARAGGGEVQARLHHRPRTGYSRRRG